jgi:hypothetical protein
MQSMSNGLVAGGILYNNGYDGYMHAINTTTGVEIWATPSAEGGLEMPQPYYPTSAPTIAGNAVFFSTSKAYEAEPLYRGHNLYALDKDTGAQLWNLSGQFSVGAVVDGKLIGTNNYDGKIYCLGKGLSAITVTAPQAAITAGTKVVIQGSVTDQTPGIAQGTPAISDNYMTQWMGYLYQDQPKPSMATGVPVTIDAVDANGNFVHIGDAVSDISGMYSYTWTPADIPGNYNIIATFCGTNSYYSSSASTNAVVVSPTATTAPVVTTNTSSNDMYYIVGGVLAMIIALAIATLVILRKK